MFALSWRSAVLGGYRRVCAAVRFPPPITNTTSCNVPSTVRRFVKSTLHTLHCRILIAHAKGVCTHAEGLCTTFAKHLSINVHMLRQIVAHTSVVAEATF